MEDFNVKQTLHSLRTGEIMSFGELIEGSDVVVVDFWHSRCTRCPEAVTLLETKSVEHPGPLYVACALSVGADRELETLRELTEDSTLTNVFMTMEQKELAKAHFGFSQVPFVVVLVAGEVRFSGNPLIDRQRIACLLASTCNQIYS